MLLALLPSPRSAFFAEDLLINALSRRGQSRKPGHLLTNPLAEAYSDDTDDKLFLFPFLLLLTDHDCPMIYGMKI